jgi:hypothetical protein
MLAKVFSRFSWKNRLFCFFARPLDESTDSSHEALAKWEASAKVEALAKTGYTGGDMRFRRHIFAAGAVMAVFLPFAVRAAAPGDLIKGPSSSAVYYVNDDGKRLAFMDEATYFTWYPDFSTVQTVSDAELAAVPFGGLVTHRPGIKMLKIQTDPKVYAVARGGVLRWIEHEWLAAVIFGTDWNRKVLDVADSMFVNFKVGDSVNDRGQYWWFRERDASPTISDDKRWAASATATPIVSATTTPIAPAGPSGKLTVTVKVVNDNAGTAKVPDFTVLLNGAPVVSGVANFVVSTTTTSLVDKIAKDGYRASTWSGDCAADGTIVVAENSDKKCEITFDDATTGQITLSAIIDNSKGGSATPSDFAYYINDQLVSLGTITRAAGTVRLTNDIKPNYASKGWSCDLNGNVNIPDNGSVSCTVTFEYIPSVP